MTRQGEYDVRAIFNDRGLVAGYIWQRRGHAVWGAILEGYCSSCTPERFLGKFAAVATAAAAVVAGLKASTRQ